VKREGSDRTSLGISGDGNTLVPQVMAAGKKCIVVFTGGTAASKEAWANAPLACCVVIPENHREQLWPMLSSAT